MIVCQDRKRQPRRLTQAVRRAALVIAAMGAIILNGANALAAGDYRLYKVTPLVLIQPVGAPTIETSNKMGTAGINSDGQVVYTRHVQAGGNWTYQAWVWLPTADYGFPAGVTYLSNSTYNNDIARDLNSAGQIGGQYGGVRAGSGLPIVCELSGGQVIYVPIPTFTPWHNNNYGGIHAISDAVGSNPPVIVGDSHLAWPECSCDPGTATANAIRAFRADYTGIGTTITLVALNPLTGPPPIDPDADSFARDIAPIPGIIAGISHCPIAGIEQDDPYDIEGPCPIWGTCAQGKDAVIWQASAADATMMSDLSIGGSEVRGVNNANETVGFGFDDGDPHCKKQALDWVTATSYTNLAAYLPSGQVNNPSLANAINNQSWPVVIGNDLGTGSAVVWFKTNGTIAWTSLELSTIPAIGIIAGDPDPQHPIPARWEIKEGHDVNDDGWLVTWGYHNGPSEIIANGDYIVLLTPDPRCASDIAPPGGDGHTDVNDLLAVINNWDVECPAGVICTNADIDGDRIVAVNDLLAVINGWGDCEQDAGGAPQTVADCQDKCAQRYPGYGSDYAQCVADCVEALCKAGLLPPEDCDN